LADEGIRLYQSGNYTEALKLFNAVIDGDPSDPRAYDARGTVYSALNDYGQAMADYNQAIKLNPSFAQAYYNRGRLYSLLKQYDEALSDLEKSSELDAASFGYRANGNIGLIYYRQGKYDEALKAYAASIAKDGTKADVFFLRGETYTALGQYEAAIADYQSAVARFSRYDLAYQSLGYAYYKTGKNDKAIEELKRAIEIAPDSPGAHFYLALVDLATGDLGGATASMSQAVDASSKLPQEDQEFLYARVTTDLKTFAKENPDRAATVESMLKLMPQPQ
jgi:tetratricopeptide (TPR) repeat protein